MPLIDPHGNRLDNPVVAHLVKVPEGSTPTDIQAIAEYWGRTLGVPAIIITGGIDLLGHVLADGTLQELPLQPELAVKVQEILTRRTNGAG